MKILHLLLLVSSFAMASKTIISPSTSESSGCDLEVIGLSSKEPFIRFYNDLRQAVAQSNKSMLSKLVLYPLRVNNNGKTRYIKNDVQFQREYKKLFNANIKKTVAEQKLDKFFCRDQGAMYGDGDLWVGLDENHKIGIKTVNVR